MMTMKQQRLVLRGPCNASFRGCVSLPAANGRARLVVAAAPDGKELKDKTDKLIEVWHGV
jgi:hypothetical protein